MRLGIFQMLCCYSIGATCFVYCQFLNSIVHFTQPNDHILTVRLPTLYEYSFEENDESRAGLHIFFVLQALKYQKV